jgi:hypothetical protein
VAGRLASYIGRSSQLSARGNFKGPPSSSLSPPHSKSLSRAHSGRLASSSLAFRHLKAFPNDHSRAVAMVLCLPLWGLCHTHGSLGLSPASILSLVASFGCGSGIRLNDAPGVYGIFEDFSHTCSREVGGGGLKRRVPRDFLGGCWS